MNTSSTLFRLSAFALIASILSIFPSECAAQIDCPDELWAEGSGCTWLFELGSFQSGEEVIWNFGNDSAVVGGHFIEYVFDTDGSQVVCAFFTSNLCPQGVELCVVIEVEGCEGGDDPCVLEIDLEENPSGEVTATPLAMGDMGNESAQWVFILNGEIVAENVDSYTVSTNVLGTDWELCVQYISDECPDGVVECVGPGAGNGGQGCPQEIWVSGAGCEYLSSVCNFTEGESVEWHYSDGSLGSGHFNTHFFEGDGVYEICAIYTSPACVEGITLCDTVVVEGCENELDECELELIVENGPMDGGPMGGWTVTATGFSDGTDLNWWVNGEVFDAGNYTPYSIMLAGIDSPFLVCAMYNTDACGQVDACDSLSLGGTDCVEGEIDLTNVANCEADFHLTLNTGNDLTSVVWDFGDGSLSDDFEWSAHHTYEEGGWYAVCATVSTADCDELVNICDEVFIPSCQDSTDCVEVGFAVDWLGGILGGMPEDVHWYLEGVNFIETGIIEYGDSPFWDHTACLPEGCYSFSLYSTQWELDEEEVFMGAFLGDEQISYASGPEWSFDSGVYEFAVGDVDCGGETEEECWLEVVVTPFTGGTWVYEAFSNDPDAQYLWTFSNGEVSDANPVEVNFGELTDNVGGCVVATLPMCEGLELLECFDYAQEGGCEDVLIVLNLSDLPAMDMELTGDLPWELAGELFDIGGLWDLADNAAGVIELCVPAGCYEVFLDLSTTLLPPAVWEMLVFNWSVDDEVLGAVSLELVDGGLLATLPIMADCIDGVHAQTAEDFQWVAYPNPARDQLGISGINVELFGQPWVLIDASGRLVHSGLIASSPNLNITVSALSEGLYTLQLGRDALLQSARVAIVR